MLPSKEDQEKVIGQCWDFTSKNPHELTDPRYGIAAACAGWDRELVNLFLNIVSEQVMQECDTLPKIPLSKSMLSFVS